MFINKHQPFILGDLCKVDCQFGYLFFSVLIKVVFAQSQTSCMTSGPTYTDWSPAPCTSGTQTRIATWQNYNNVCDNTFSLMAINQCSSDCQIILMGQKYVIGLRVVLAEFSLEP